jgi:CRISPR/Cas system CSM-associated protein Csm4 (group 5 of RAMP superfamily)
MPTVTTYLLRFRGPLHVAERGVGIEETAEFVHSDTLFSALCSVVRLGWGESELQRLLAPFRAGDPPFLLSSAFPFAGSVRFLPKPHLALPTPPPEDARKRLRQTRWVSLGLFQAWLSGELPGDVETALAELGQLGLGGLRSTGHGQFTVQPGEEVAFPERATSRGLVTLSLYAPGRSELAAGVLGPLARYDLVVRGGWIASPDGASYRRRELRMVSEGSVVMQPPGTTVLGQLVDVTPEVMRTVHPVYRYGYAFTVPVDLKE